MAIELSGKVISALSTAVIENNSLRLTCGQLPKEEYRQLKEVMGRIQGQWRGGKLQSFCFPDEQDTPSILADILQNGVMPERNRYSFHPTPVEVIELIAQAVDLDGFAYFEDGIYFLEPSAGGGEMADYVHSVVGKCTSTLVEIDPVRCATLRKKGYAPIECDFLNFESPQPYDLIVMNPPFDGIECIKHFLHAYGMLGESGKMACVLPAAIFTKTHTNIVAKAVDIVNRLGFWESLPDGVFPTAANIETTVAIVDKHPGFPVNVVERLILHLGCDSEFRKLVEAVSGRCSGVQCDLLGEPVWAQVEKIFMPIVNSLMAKFADQGAFFVLSSCEKREIISHYWYDFVEGQQ